MHRILNLLIQLSPYAIAMHHPCLIAYEDLPEKEKIYDRNSSIETLKLILKLGFEIERK